MVEIKGFDNAYNNMLASEKVKELNKRATKRRITELVAQGVDLEVAKVMAECGL